MQNAKSLEQMAGGMIQYDFLIYTKDIEICNTYLDSKQHHRVFWEKLKHVGEGKVCNVAFIWFWVEHEHDTLHACNQVTMSQYNTLKYIDIGKYLLLYFPNFLL